jgi:hypothetical protein
MFIIWLILGAPMIAAGIFDRQILRAVGFKEQSSLITSPALRKTAVLREQLARWVIIVLGASFIIQGLGGLLPANLSLVISAILFGAAWLILLVMIVITIVVRKPHPSMPVRDSDE